MSALLISLLAGLALGGWGCADEPDRVVRSTTAEGSFALTLTAARDWVRPGGNLPIQVRVESLQGPVPEELVEEIELVANNGTLSPTRLTVVMAGPDSLGQGAESRFAEWVTFTAARSPGADLQGEVYVLFRDTSATLKIRIVPAVE